jgi:two-component sensor histidine kinase
VATEAASVGTPAAGWADRFPSPDRLRTVAVVATLVLASLLPLFGFVGWRVHVAATATAEDTRLYLAARVEELSATVDAEMRQQLAVLRAVAALPDFEPLDRRGLHDRLKAMSQAIPEWLGVAVVDTASMLVVVNPYFPFDKEPVPVSVPEVVRRVADTRAPTIFSREPKPQAPYPGPVLNVLLPIIQGGSVPYVLIGFMRTENLQSILLRRQWHEGTLGGVVDEHGKIIASKRDPERLVGREASPELRQTSTARATGLIESTSPYGERLYTAYVRSPFTGWTSAVGTTRSTIDEAAQRGIWTLILTAAICATLAVTLATLFFSLFVARRVDQERSASAVALHAADQRSLAELRAASDRQRLLINELNHRVKNTLATIQSMARLTLRGPAIDPQTREVFEDRLMALSRTHDVLTRESWEGADLRDVIDEAVAPHCGSGGDRFRLAGPTLRLPPKAALAFAMALHELCTNAAKYGALRGEAGTVAITWRVDDRARPPRLDLRWEERDGPAVTPPDHQAFGTLLVKRMLAMELRGQVELDFRPEGLVCRVSAPVPVAGRGAASEARGVP